MKKITTIALGGLLLFTLSGCATSGLSEKVENTIQQKEKANVTSLENDVRNTVTNVATYIASNPTAKDLSNVKIVQSEGNTIKINIPTGKTIYEYQVIGINSNGETFSFDGGTGEYK